MPLHLRNHIDRHFSRQNAHTVPLLRVGLLLCRLLWVLLHIYKTCSLKDVSSHSGRRTFIIRLASKDVGVRVLAELAGHSSIATTQHYIDVNAEQLAQAVDFN